MWNKHGVIVGSKVEAAHKIRDLKAVIFDADGVLTDNCVLEGLEGSKPRWRSHYDGQGISLLRAVRIHVCFITAESGVDAQAIDGLVERWNGLPSTIGVNNPGGWGKVGLFKGLVGIQKLEAAEEWLSEHNMTWAECAVMGDDLVDVPMLRKARLKVAPRSAEQVVLSMADFVSRRPGGGGAIRDLVNFILEIKGVDQTTLSTR